MSTASPDLADGIAIVGRTGRFPGADTIEQFWQNLRDGVESITVLTDEQLLAAGIPQTSLANPRYVKASTFIKDVELFDAGFFGFNPREAEVIDPQQRLFLEACWEVLEQAGYDPETYRGLIGVYAGIGVNAYAYNLARSAEAAKVGGYQLGIGNDKDFLTTRVSYKLNLKGPSVVVQTACSTSLVAVYQACESLQSYRCDMALAGGVAINVHDVRGYFHQDGMILSPDGHCRAFDAKARGTVSGKGLGVVVLKRLADAIQDRDTIHAVIKGWAINNDGSNKVGYTAPSVEGQAQVIAEALAMSNVPAESIGYVEAHGTGTELGDPIEIGALNMAYRAETDRRHFCAIGSLKTNIGHLDTAAGVAGLIKAVLTLERRELPPSLHFEEPNPQIDFEDSPFFVNTRLTPWEPNGVPRRAGVSSFGIGGTNAHVVLEEAPVVPAGSPSRNHQLLVVSARSAAALDRATAQLAGYLTSHPDASLPDVAYTLQVGRHAFDHRRALVCAEAADAMRVLSEPRDKRLITATRNRHGAACAFMFSGQGSQRVNMGRELYAQEPVFRDIVDECAALLEPSLGFDLRTALYPHGDLEAATALLTETRVTQPALFVTEYALAKLWTHWGITPAAMIGHSIGEYVAACLSGVFSLSDALALVAARGRLMQQQPAGTMLAVQLTARDVQPMMNNRLSLAAENAPGLCVVAGETSAIEALEAQLTSRNVFTRRLHTSHAFHSHMMDGALPAFRAELDRVTFQEPQIPYVSNVTGTWITAAEATNPAYWTAHLRQAVRFADGVRALLASEVQALLEVGPGNTLRSLVSQQIETSSGRLALASWPGGRDSASDQASMLDALGRLWTAGATIDWSAFYAAEQRRRIPLPTYPFERQRYWIDLQAPLGTSRVETAAQSLQKRADPGNWFYLPIWKRTLVPQPQPPADPTAGECWLIFDDLKGLGAQLAQQLAVAGHDAYRIVPARGFAPLAGKAFSLDLEKPSDYDKLLAELHALDKHPRRIVHLTTLAADAPESFQQEQARGFYSLLYLAQAIGRQRVSRPIDVTVVSSGLHDILPGDAIVAERSTLMGACTVMQQEYANIWCNVIDIGSRAGNRDADPIATLLFRELQSDRRDWAAYRGQSRFVPSFEEQALLRPPASAFKQGGVYFITGGLGSVGLSLADHLARTQQAKLVLVGRTVPPPRDQWAATLAAPPSPRAAFQIQAVQHLEKQGAEVLCLSADVADEAQMRAAVAAADRAFGRIDGVIHAAGMVGGEGFGGIQELTPARCASQFHPKVLGLLALERALEGRTLDLCLLTSSISCELGGLGYAAYAAANHFVSAFASDRRKQGKLPWLALDLDGLKFGDGGVKTALSELLMTGPEGIDAMERALALEHGPARLVVSTANLIARLNQYARKAPPTQEAPAQETAPAAPSGHARPELANPYEAPVDEIEQTLVRIWQELLGIDQVGRLDDFFELGGHSLLAVQVVSRVEQACAVQVSLRDIFEARTVAELAERIKTMKWLMPGDAVESDLEEREEIEI